MNAGSDSDRPSASGRLESWKDIAAYLNRGVRTVVRWEQEEGLPVHRLLHDARASVYAFRSELDDWRLNRSRKTAPSAGPVPSLVVLPFTGIGADPQDEYFGDGLAEELTNVLSRIPGLRVIARTSAFAFKGKPADVCEIARHLRVANVVEGAVRHAGGQLRITVRLVHVSDRSCIWSESFDRQAGELLAIQSEIAGAVVTGLKVRLLGGDPSPLTERRSIDPEAYDLYLRGRHFLARRTPEALVRAAAYFRQALERSPGDAPTCAALAECYCVTGFLGFGPPKKAFALARTASAEARRLDLTLSELDAIDGYIAFAHDWNWSGAGSLLQRAGERSPNYAPAPLWRSFLMSVLHRHEAAEVAVERAWELDPLSLYVQTHVGLAALWARRYDAALARFRNVLAMDPDFALANFHLGRTCLILGRTRESVPYLQRASAAIPTALGALAFAHVKLGERKRAMQVVTEMERLSTSQYVGPMAFAAAHMGLNVDRSIEWIGRALDEREGMAILLGVDPGFDGLRDHPGYHGLLQRMGLPRRTAS